MLAPYRPQTIGGHQCRAGPSASLTAAQNSDSLLARVFTLGVSGGFICVSCPGIGGDGIAVSTEVSRSRSALASGDQFTTVDKQGKTVARRQKIHPVTIKAGVPASFIAYAQGETPIELYLVRDGQIVAQHAQGRWFPYVSYTSDKDLSADVYVVGPDQDVTYTLMQFAWAGQGS